MTRFVIMCAARTGSSMLRRLLDSHPDIRCEGEVIMGRVPKDPIHVLEERVYCAPIAGFKIRHEQLVQARLAEVLEWLLAERSIKVIHLRREDLLARYVSEVAARRYGYPFGLAKGAKRPPTPRFSLTREECLADFRKQRWRQRHFRHLFREHESINVTYERLRLPGIQRFLGVEPRPLSQPLVKQLPHRLEQVLTNYEELRRLNQERVPVRM